MSIATDTIFAEWTLPPCLTLSLLLTGAIYLRGWLKLRLTRPAQFTVWRLLAFHCGLLVLWLAVGSPIDGFADVLLSAHMVEHLLVMSAVPPLLLLGLPLVPLLRGLPPAIRRWSVHPLLRVPVLRKTAVWTGSPLTAWVAMNVTFLTWHVPSFYCFAVEHETWHVVEHISFLSTSTLFWWCILRPWPANRGQRSWSILFYLVSADILNTVLSAFLSFCGRPVYPCYFDHPNPFGVAALDDQVQGAVIMWVLGSVAFLVPVMFLTNEMLQPVGGGLARQSG